MSKILVVFGATGNQGGSVIACVLADPELSKQYKIRAVTRDVNSSKAKALAEQTEVVQADLRDRASIEKALTGANSIFLVTAPYFQPGEEIKEYEDATLVADIAVEKNVEYLVFSTLPYIREISNGKYTKSHHTDNKARAERYIRNLSIKSSFVSLGGFMQMLQTSFYTPKQINDDEWIFSFPGTPNHKMAYVDVEDTGKFVGAILAEPEKYEGKFFAASAQELTHQELVEIFSRHTGKKISFNRLSIKEFEETWPFAVADFVDFVNFIDEYGLYGPGGHEQIGWAVQNARGKVNTLEDYLRKHPIQLE